MNQTNERGARPRRLTPEQRRRLLELRRRQRRRRRLMIAGIAVVLVIVVLALVFALRGGRGERTAQPDDVIPEITAEPVSSEQEPVAEADTEPVAEADAEQLPEASATPEPAPKATQEPITYQPAGGTFVYDDAYAAAVRGEVTGPGVEADLSQVDPSKLDRWPKVKEGYLPLIRSAKTDEKIIAITVDDCYQPDNLRQIVQCALDNGGRLTIFPIGENLVKQSIGEAVKWAWEQGMEIENHSYKHLGTYHYDDDDFTSDIWTQSAALNKALGVNYKQHFFRPKGGDERDDQRTHAYVSQLGMSGIALWSVTGSGSSTEFVKSKLAPGAVYLFHTTNSDMEMLLQLIPYAVSQGYRLVTLNEMFGLPENETGEYVAQDMSDKPALQSFKLVPRQMQKTVYMRAAAVVQKRLVELGYLSSEPDGVYGGGTVKAISNFQSAVGLKADGIAGAETQKALFADDAPRNR